MDPKDYRRLSYKDFLKATAFAGVIAAPVLLVTAFAAPATGNLQKRADFMTWTNKTTNPLVPAIIKLTQN